jgi:hypothetical protein
VRGNAAALPRLHLIEPGNVLVNLAPGHRDVRRQYGAHRPDLGRARLVTDSATRDVAEIIELGIPIFCRIRRFRARPGDIGLPSAMGEVAIEAGGLTIGERDRLIAAPRTTLEQRIATSVLQQVPTPGEEQRCYALFRLWRSSG